MSEIEELKAKLASLERQIEEANDSIHVMHSDCSTLTVERDEARSQLEEAKAEQLFSQRLVPKLIAERDAALDQVVGLEFKVRSLHIGLRLLCPLTHPKSEARKWADHNLATPLPEATSTTASQRVEAIRREAVGKALAKLTKGDFRVQQWSEKMGCGWVSLTAETALATLLGEKEKK